MLADLGEIARRAPARDVAETERRVGLEGAAQHLPAAVLPRGTCPGCASCTSSVTAATWRSRRTRTSCAEHGEACSASRLGRAGARALDRALDARVNLAAARLRRRACSATATTRVRFEDLCADAAGAAEELLAWAGLEGDASAAVAAVAAPAGIGRWRAADPALVADLEARRGRRPERVRLRRSALTSRDRR